jgi:hypothetical protein
VRLALGVAPAAPPFEASFERAPWFPSYGRRCERWAVRVHRAAALLPVVASFRLSLEPPTGEVGG